MFNYASYCKRFVIVVIFILLSFDFKIPYRTVYAIDSSELENEFNDNIDSILDKTDFSILDDDAMIVPDLNLSFKDYVKSILNGESGFEYNSLFDNIKSCFLKQIKDNLRFFITLFIIIFLFEIFKSFSNSNYAEINSSLKIIFSFLLSATILIFVKGFYVEITELIDDLFLFSSRLFPILIGFLTLSGATKSALVFSSFSAFLLQTGSYLIKFVLLPLALSILFLSLFGSLFSKGNFSKLTSLFKQIFKYIIIGFFAIFGLISTINVISTASHDGINLKLTKFALKNYIPVLGGYVSEGFDFIYSCSILIKNAVGVCSIIIMVFKILVPLIVIIVFSIGFKILSVVTGLVGDSSFSNMFEDISNAFSNFLSIVLGLFLICFIFIFLVILSVSVV